MPNHSNISASTFQFWLMTLKRGYRIIESDDSHLACHANLGYLHQEHVAVRAKTLGHVTTSEPHDTTCHCMLAIALHL